MRPPTDFEIDELRHVYNPIKAHDYYLRTRQLKGRQRGHSEDTRPIRKTREQISKDVRAQQRKELAHQIQDLETKLSQLGTRIREREDQEASENRKAKAKKERARKEADKPKTVVEKVEIVHENKNRTNSKSKQSVSDLKALATKVRGQIAVAKQKLAAL